MDTKPNSLRKKVISFIFFISFAAILFMLFRADAGEKISLVAWITKSSNPELGIIALAILVLSVLWISISKGILSEISILNIKIDPNTRGFRYFFSIPSWLLAIFSILSLAYLLFIPPECASPNITFQLNFGEETKEYTPQSNVDVGLLSSVIVTIKSEETFEDIECTFQASGDGLERYNSHTKSCSTTIFFKNEPSSIVVSSKLQGKYCPNSSYFSITLNHQ
jgi:hypothetical protein